MKNCPICKSRRIIRVDNDRATHFCHDCQCFFDDITGEGYDRR